MVLKTLVLPAPLGPITEVICPGAAVKETPRSAWMPPKRRSTPSTASDAPGAATAAAPAAAGEDVAERALCRLVEAAKSMRQIRLLRGGPEAGAHRGPAPRRRLQKIIRYCTVR